MKPQHHYYFSICFSIREATPYRAISDATSNHSSITYKFLKIGALSK